MMIVQSSLRAKRHYKGKDNEEFWDDAGKD